MPGARDNIVPPTNENSAKPMDKITTVRGVEEIRVADAPGVTIKARTRIAPTTGTASALANPIKSANMIEVSLGDTPRAAATSGSVLANRSGR